MRQLLLSLALVQAQYHQHHMPRAKFDDQTGAPLNDAARSILQRHAATAPAPGAGAAEAFDSLVDVVVAAGTWKFVMLECELDGRRRRIVRALQGLKYHAENYDVTAAPLKALGIHVRVVGCCVEINQCVGCSFLGDDAAVLAPSSGEEPASLRHRAGVASMAWRTTRRFSTNAP